MRYLCLFLLTLASGGAFADMAAFHDGPLIPGYGQIADVKQDMSIAAGTHFKVAFDVSAGAEPGKINRGFESLARFLNMQVANGTAAADMDLALVVHGAAAFDLLQNQSYKRKHQTGNPNAVLLGLLMQHRVKVYLCGQSAVAQDVHKADLVEGVQMALSAITAHALLAQQGYSENPF